MDLKKTLSYSPSKYNNSNTTTNTINSSRIHTKNNIVISPIK